MDYKQEYQRRISKIGREEYNRRAREYYQKNREYHRKYYQEHKDEICQKAMERYYRNKNGNVLPDKNDQISGDTIKIKTEDTE